MTALMYDHERADLVAHGGYALENAAGEVLALFDDWAEQDYWIEAAKMAYDDVRTCGHPAAAGWLNARTPLTVHAITREQREDHEADGTPWLQREP